MSPAAGPAGREHPGGEPSRAYLDHAATSVLRPEAREAYLEASGVVGNPSAVHASGRRARGVLDRALATLAELLDVPVSWLLLTSGGTEADNLALRAVPLARRAAEPVRSAVAVAATDHPAVLATARSLAVGPTPLAVREIAVTRDGALDVGSLDAVLADGAVGLVSAALVNNETGAIADLADLSARARAHGTLVHTDAVQAAGHVPLPDPALYDLLSLTGHKIGAPVGVGLLVARPEVPFAPTSTGGGQQRGVRSGTLDAAGAAALAAALGAAFRDRDAQAARARELRDRLLRGIAAIDPTAAPTLADGASSPHIVHLLFPGAEADSLLFLLDERGVDASAGSACAAGVTQSSPVLTALGVPEREARGALRVSFGWTTTAADVDRLLAALPEALRRSRAVGALRG